MWNIVNSFFFLFGDSIASLEAAHHCSTASERQGGGGGGGKAFADEQVESGADVNGGDPAAPPATHPSAPPGGEHPSSVLLPAHLLAVAGQVDRWLPGWLRSLPTGRLVRAVNDAGLLEAMARRCKLRGRVPFNGLREAPPSDPPVVAASNGAGGSTVSSSVPASALPEPCPPGAVVVRHRLSVSAGSASGAFCSAGSASGAPLGRAFWLSAADLERALLLQSVSFLGILATHCRGTLQPYPPSRDNEEGNEDGSSGGEVEGGEAGEEDGVDRGLEQGKEALRALVQCVRGRGSRRAERGTKTQRLPRQQSSPASASEDGAGSRPVRLVALGYVGQLAKATAGGAPSPFTAPIIDRLFAPLGGTPSNGEGQGDSLSEEESSDLGAARGEGAGKPLGDESPAFLGALAEIAGVLLSSRCASAGFFGDDGPGGPRASRALLGLLRCTYELARRACRDRGGSLDGEPDGGGIFSEEGHADGPPARRFSSLGREDSKRLAVEFACALAPIMGNPPKLRAAGRAALWRCGVPHALAELVAYLGDARPDQSALGKAGPYIVSDGNGYASGRSGTGGGGGRGGRHNSAQEDGELRDRLLMSLVEWARDLAGVSSLRLVGLAGPCGSFLSRELGVRQLDRSTRDECADPQLLAVAMRLALFPESLSELLSASGGVVNGVKGGLSRLGELTTLPELLQSHAVGLPPPHAVAPPRLSGRDGEFGGCTRGDVPGRSPGLQLGGGAGDLRCLEFICRLSASGALCAGSDPADPAAVQMRRWLRWGLSRVVPPRLSSRRAFLDAGDDDDAAVAEGEEEDADVAQDVRVVALELVAKLAADLTTAVEIEADWSLTENLARHKADEDPAGVRPAGVRPAGVSAGGSAGGGEVERRSSKSGPAIGNGGGKQSFGSITCVPDVVEPAALGRARLAVSLTCLGGPNEERHTLLRKLQEAEALAGNDLIGSGYGGAPDAAPVRTASGIRIQGLSGAVPFPDDGASDEAWWDVAGRCAPMVAALLAGPHGAGRTEAFSLLRKASSRRSLLCPERPRPPELATTDCCASPGANGESGDSAVEGGLPGRRHAAINRLCFSYARSLGFVDDGRRDQFEEGLKSALAASAGSAPPSPDCDWFAAVAFIASGADGVAASAMLQNLRRHTTRAAFVVPRAGRRYPARRAELETAGGVAVPGEPLPPVASERMRSSPGIAAGFSVWPSPSASDGLTVAAATGSSTPPLLVLLGLVEEVLEEELPLLSAALRSSGWAAAPLAGRWIRQSMLSVVDWPGVVAYLALTLLRGRDYQVRKREMSSRLLFRSHSFSAVCAG